MRAFLFSFVVAFWTDKAFVTYFVVSMMLTDVICNAEIKFLRFYSFPTPHSAEESLWFFRERENVLIISRDAWNDEILLRNSILARGIRDPDETATGCVMLAKKEMKYKWKSKNKIK